MMSILLKIIKTSNKE